jgi:hypothetical protein
MRYLAKVVAGILAVALWAMPLQAAVSCLSNTHASMPCADCCASKAKAAKTAEATRATNMELAISTQPAQGPCCKVSSGESLSPAIPQKFHRSITRTVLPVYAYTPAQSTMPSANIQMFPDRWTNGRAQPILCTFLI